MPLYDIMCIASTSAPNTHLVSLLKKCAQTLGQHGGAFRGIQHVGIRPLAYRMKAHAKFNEFGRFVRLRIQASPAALAAFQHRLRIDEEVVRFLTIKEDEIAPKPKKDPLYRGGFFNRHGFTHSKYSAMDYHVARALLRAGKLTRREVAAMPKRFSTANA